MAKHADPTRASVFVTPKNGSVLLVLEDDGNGFDPAKVRNGGLGLEGMRERVELLEGRMTIESSEERRDDPRRRGAGQDDPIGS